MGRKRIIIQTATRKPQLAMTGIFISDKRENQATAKRLAEAFGAKG